MARKFWIAVSVFFGLLTVALCLLWVRSFWRSDVLFCGVGAFTLIESNCGHLILFSMSETNYQRPMPSNWEWQSAAAIRSDAEGWYRLSATQSYFNVPYWLMTLVSGLIACQPWLAFRRFSLRALLIATTLAAIVLGLVVWAAG